MTVPLLTQLVRTLARPIAESDRARARLHLLDWLACVAGARRGLIASQVRFGTDRVIWKAALLGNELEMDDVHRSALLHPGPVVWPTALVVTAEFDLVLDSAIRGYEAMIAIGATFDEHHYSHFHPTSTAGVFGAAATASSIYKATDVEIANALGLAGSVAGGLWQMRHENVMAKQWHVVNAMQTGGESADWACSGMTGPASLLEGPQGLYAATCRQPKPMTFPEQWRIHEVSFKPWAACRHVHPAIDCALELRAAGKLAAPFHVEAYADAIAFCDRPDPVTGVDAKFSLQHGIAVIADGRNAEPADFTPEAIAALAPLRALVSVSEAPDITARYPEHFGARVNGLELVDTRGDPERPVGEAEIIAKVRTLVAWGGLPAEEADRAVELALRGDDAEAISAMLHEWLA